MSSYSVSTFDTGGPAPLRTLDPVELRVLGSLLEKQQTTPDQYPLSPSALVAACNQKSNREPVTRYSAQEITEALERLQSLRLVRQSSGARSPRWEHLLDYRLPVGRAAKALLTVLMLRGAQTTGELRSRTERLHPFTSVSEVEEALAPLAERSTPLVRELPRRSGQKESRWMQLLGEEVDQPDEAADLQQPRRAPDRQVEPARSEPLAERVRRLEEGIRAARAEVRELTDRLGG
jgi:uncharacterized protein